MASKATVQRQKSANKVTAAVETHMGTIAGEMGKKYGEEVIPAVKLVLERVAADLSAKADIMVVKDDEHENELRDDPAARSNRDSKTDELHDCLVTGRDQLDTICGPEYVARLGFDGPTPDDPVVLHRLGKTVSANLVEIKPPEPRIPGYKFDPNLWRKPIVALLDDLDESVAKIAEEQRQAEATLMAKRNAIDEYDKAFSSAANLTSVLLRIAGETELAKRVRPSARRAGQTAEVAQDTASLGFGSQ